MKEFQRPDILPSGKKKPEQKPKQTKILFSSMSVPIMPQAAPAATDSQSE